MRGTKYLSEILPIDKIIKSDKRAFIISLPLFLCVLLYSFNLLNNSVS